ncbi:cohesin domain-containing protein [Anaerosporobacter faecicola]|uniref:cohesin domain-containing protein n=1 Tax=Anaerosporobacter faecicola TaxID=2718714 RepID=UPI001438DC4E|nr:cohesin domain-containing protein [Anaerosporobacter faecicola]
MKQRKKAIVIYSLLICLIVSLMPDKMVQAASATVSITQKEDSVKQNDTFSVTVKVVGTEEIGGFETLLSYDNDKLEFVSGGSLVSGDDGILRISDLNPENVVTSRKYVLQFKAIEQGNAKIEVIDQAYVYTYEDSAEMSVSCNSLSINIETDEKVSKNTKLYSLKISPGSLSPEFSEKTTSYTAEVDADVSELVISAMAQDADAKVKTKGNTDLKPGNNEVQITVTAPSGDKKTYTIVVHKASSQVAGEEQEQGEEIPEEEEEKKQEDTLQEVLETDGYVVTQEEESVFLQFAAEYEVVPVDDTISIPTGYEATTRQLQGVTVDVYEPEGGAVSDYVLIYMKKADGVPQFYRYDRLENTVQRYDSTYDQTTTVSTGTVSKDEYAKKLDNMRILVVISCIIALGATLVVIRLLVKLRGVKDDEFY